MAYGTGIYNNKGINVTGFLTPIFFLDRFTASSGSKTYSNPPPGKSLHAVWSLMPLNNDNYINLPVPTVTINGTEYKLYDALLELANDSRLDTDAYYFKTSVLGQQFGLNDPVCSTDIAGNKLNPSLTGNSADAVKPQFVNDIKSYLEGFETVINSTSYETSDAQFEDMKKFIDVDSFVDFYITSEYFMTKDIGFSSTRFYIKNGKL